MEIHCFSRGVDNVENHSELWTSMRDGSFNLGALTLSFYVNDTSAVFEGSKAMRISGCAIRPVKYDENYVWPNS